MAEHHITGEKGESLAAKYLQEKGYVILETNWNFKSAEIDIIAQHNDILIIVEVKTRKSNYFGEPEEWVTKQKQKHLIKAAQGYIEKNNLTMEARFDIVSIILGRDKYQINHICDAFYPLL